MKTIFKVLLIVITATNITFAKNANYSKIEHNFKNNLNYNKTNILTFKKNSLKRCRNWSVGFSMGGVSVSTDVTLCCTGAAWSYPYISCFEIPHLISNAPINAYIMLERLNNDTIEKLSYFSKGDILEITSSSTEIAPDEKSYFIKKGFYKIEINNQNQKYIKVELQKI